MFREMQRSIFRSPLFWGGVGVAAVGAAYAFHRKREHLLGRGNAGPEPFLVKRNPAVLPPPTEVRNIDGRTLTRYETARFSIDQRLKLIQKRVWDGVNDPRIRKLALQVTQGCGRDDGACEAQKIFDFAKANVRYTGDVGPVINPKTGEVDGIDYYQNPWVTYEYKGGDCDDAVGFVGSMLAVIGHTVRLRVTAPSRFGEFAHIYPVTLLPKDQPRKARAVDITLPWKAVAGSEAKYGRARDYQVEAPA